MAASPRRLFEIPAVVRLRRLVRWRNRFRVVYNKRNILKRDHNRCQYCGRPGRDLTLDHILPLSRGGTDDWHNVVTACRECNRRKGSLTPEEAGLSLARKPWRPHYLFLFLAGDYPDPATASQWEKYLPLEPKGSYIH